MGVERYLHTSCDMRLTLLKPQVFRRRHQEFFLLGTSAKTTKVKTQVSDLFVQICGIKDGLQLTCHGASVGFKGVAESCNGTAARNQLLKVHDAGMKACSRVYYCGTYLKIWLSVQIQSAAKNLKISEALWLCGCFRIQ